MSEKMNLVFGRCSQEQGCGTAGDHRSFDIECNFRTLSKMEFQSISSLV